MSPWRSLRARPLRALQVEVTSRCDQRCAVCPRTALAGRWREQDLDQAAWRSLAPDLGLARHVHLQGWGEPLLHPGIPRMAADARAAGCRVGLTTNGTLVPHAIDWLVGGDVDLVTLSVGGGARGDNDVRDGSPAAWHAVSVLAERRPRRRPKVQVSFLLTADNAPQLPGAVAAAARAGVDELFVVHLDVTPTAALQRRAAFGEDGLRAGVEPHLHEAAAVASRLGLAYRGPTRVPGESLVCALDPTTIAFVASDGRVGPCVNLLPPVEGRIRRCSDSGAVEVRPVAFGDLHDAPLRVILSSAARRRFTALFEARRAAERRFLAAQGGWGSAALERLERADAERSRALAESPFPTACAGCPKALGW